MRYLFYLLLLILTIPGLHAEPGYREITLGEVADPGAFRARGIGTLVAMKDGKHYARQDGNCIFLYSFPTGEKAGILFDPGMHGNADFSFSNFSFSKDEQKILLTTGKQSIYRHSFIADYYVFDRATHTLESVSRAGKQMLATLSPDGRKVAFVRNNNLFYRELGHEGDVQVTFDGAYNRIINGATDWVYEEEFALTQGFEWSPDGRKIAFYRFDESHVRLFHMPFYRGELYPVDYTFKYPKAGERNAVVKILVFDLSSGKTIGAETGREPDQYIPRVKWTANPSMLSVTRMNRLQNHLEILMVDAETGNSAPVYSEKNWRYVDEPDAVYPHFTADGKSFILASEKDGFNHLYCYDINGNLLGQITRGSWDVTAFYGLDEKKGWVYYQSAERSPLCRDVYRIRLNGTGKARLSERPGTNSASFSSDFGYYIHTHSSATVPDLITLHDAKGKMTAVLEDNADLLARTGEYGVEPREFFVFTNREGVSLHASMIKPPDFDPAVKYPVLLSIYGGPGSQNVSDRWAYGWDQYLAQQGIVVVSVDCRGTGFRGEEFKKQTYGQLGKYETDDFIDAAMYLGSLGFIDPGRIGITGGSYGGYMSLLCIFKGAEVFKLAVSRSPVTSWRFYDTVYTERFMGLPGKNPSGYDDNSPLNHAHLFRGKLLIIHGTADDNVHFQNTVEMVNRLVESDKDFELFIYPDRAHTIRGGNSRLHMYRLMSSYLVNEL